MATDPRYDVTMAPAHPHASKQVLNDVLKPSYWRSLCPHLHVGDAAFVSSSKPAKLPKERLRDVSGQVNAAGVAQVRLQQTKQQEQLPKRRSQSEPLLTMGLLHIKLLGWQHQLASWGFGCGTGLLSGGTINVGVCMAVM